MELGKQPRAAQPARTGPRGPRPRQPSPRELKRRTRRRRLRRFLLFAVVSSLVVILAALVGLLYFQRQTAVAVSELCLVGTDSAGVQQTCGETQQLNLAAVAAPSVVLAADGSEIATIPAAADRKPVARDQMGLYTPNALIVTEDGSFFSRGDVMDWRSTAIAFGQSVLSLAPDGIKSHLPGALRFSGTRGGSGINQQLARIKYLNMQQSTTGGKLDRKYDEYVIAKKMQQTYTRDQILDEYLNSAFFGRGAYGIQAAAQAYYGKDASQLSAGESTFLITKLRAPNANGNAETPEQQLRTTQRDVDRINASLKLQLEAGAIGQASFDEATKQFASSVGDLQSGARPYPTNLGIIAAKPPVNDPNLATWKQFVRAMTVQYVNATYGSDEFDPLAVGGLTITTTINPRLMETANDAVAQMYTDNKRVFPANGGDGTHAIKAGLCSIDPTTGALVAFYAGDDYNASQFNYCTQVARSIGSTAKVFNMTEMVQQGISVESVFPSPAYYTNPDGTKTYNDDRAAHGWVKLTDALAYSFNPPQMSLVNGYVASPDDPDDPVKLSSLTGDDWPVTIENVTELTRAMIGPAPLVPGGRDPVIGTTPVMAIGAGAALTPDMVASAYGVIANDGYLAQRHFVSGITGLEGRFPGDDVTNGGYQVRPVQVIDSSTARTMAQVMRGVFEKTEATGAANQIGRQVAGKTGTTDTDGWFTGFNAVGSDAGSTALVTSVWFGHENEEPLRDRRGNQLFGGVQGGALWANFMERALDGTPKSTFKEANLSDGTVIDVQELMGEKVEPTATPTESPTGTASPDVTATGEPTESASDEPTITGEPTEEPSSSSSSSQEPEPDNTGVTATGEPVTAAASHDKAKAAKKPQPTATATSEPDTASASAPADCASQDGSTCVSD